MRNIYFLLVLIFTSSIVNAQWTQIGQDIDGEAADDLSGYSISLSSDGSIVAIGAINNAGSTAGQGQVRVYQNNSGAWTQIGQDIDGEYQGDSSGWSVSLSSDGSIVAIGAPDNISSGQVRVYQNNSGTWTQIGQDIDGEAPNDDTGFSVSLSNDGSIVAIGANRNDGASGTDSGHVRIYQNNSGTWTQIGQDIDGEYQYDGSGWSVSLNGDGSIVAIGAPTNYGNGLNSGHTRIYQNNSGTWTQIGQDIDGEADGDQSGWSVSLNNAGSIVAIGAPYNSGNGGNISGSGHVRIYQYNSGTWTQIGQDIDGEAAGDQSGYSVSMNNAGSIVAIGAPVNSGNGVNLINSGHVRIYQNNSGTWTQIGQDIDGEAANDFSGTSVSLDESGSKVAIGAFRNDGNGIYSGHVRVYSNPLLTNNNSEIEGIVVYSKAGTILSNNPNLSFKVFNVLGQNIPNKNLITGLYIVLITNMTTQTKNTRKVLVKN